MWYKTESKKQIEIYAGCEVLKHMENWHVDIFLDNGLIKAFHTDISIDGKLGLIMVAFSTEGGSSFACTFKLDSVNKIEIYEQLHLKSISGAFYLYSEPKIIFQRS